MRFRLRSGASRRSATGGSKLPSHVASLGLEPPPSEPVGWLDAKRATASDMRALQQELPGNSLLGVCSFRSKTGPVAVGAHDAYLCAPCEGRLSSAGRATHS